MEQGSAQLISRHGVHCARLDNTGTRDVGAKINALIEAHWAATLAGGALSLNVTVLPGGKKKNGSPCFGHSLFERV